MRLACIYIFICTHHGQCFIIRILLCFWKFGANQVSLEKVSQSCEDKARWPMTRSIYFRSTYLLYLKGIVFRFKFQFMIPFLTFVLQFSHQIQSKWLTYCSSSAVWIFEKLWLTFALVQGTFRQHWIDSLTNIWQWFCMNHIDHAYRHKILLNSTRYNMCYISLHFTFY